MFLARYTESIPVSSGLGWDGFLYAEIAIDPLGKISSGNLEKQRIQRIFPSILAHIIIHITGRDLNHQNAIISFQIINALCMTLSIYFFISICKYLSYSKKQILIGLTLCFLNFHFIKFYSYYPVLTDYFAYFISILSTYFWVKNQKYSLITTAVIGAFTWPALFLQNLIQISFEFERNKTNNFTVKLQKNHALIAFISVSLGILLNIYTLNLINASSFPNFETPRSLNLWIGVLNLFLTTSICIYFIMHSLLSNEYHNAIFNLQWKWITCSLILFVSLNTIISSFPSFESGVSFKYTLNLFLIRSYEFPFINLLSHSVVFSPIVIYFLFKPNLINNFLQNFGLGNIFIFILSIPFLLNSESRHLLHFYPLFIILIVKISDLNFYFLIVIQLLLSAAYLNFNNPEFNLELFFMFQGPFITTEYYIYLLVASTVALILFSLCNTKPRMPS